MKKHEEEFILRPIRKYQKLKVEPHRAALLFLLGGIIFGALYANIFRDIYIDNIEFFDSYYISKMNLIEIDYGLLFQYIIMNSYKQFILFWIFSITILGIPYMVFSLIYFGFSTGFIISVATMKYGIKGLLLFLTYIFPQYIIYIPAALVCLLVGYRLCKDMNASNSLNGKNKWRIVIEKLPIIFLLGVFILIGCVMETYINSFLLKKVIQML